MVSCSVILLTSISLFPKTLATLPLVFKITVSLFPNAIDLTVSFTVQIHNTCNAINEKDINLYLVLINYHHIHNTLLTLSLPETKKAEICKQRRSR